MIDRAEIDGKASEFKISPRSVEKDYVFGWILSGIYGNPILKEKLILKGGNALRKGYLPRTRFSKDLDFSTLHPVDTNELIQELNSILTTVHDQTGINFLLNKTQIEPKLVIDNKQVYVGRTVFQGFYQEEEEAPIKIQMDITEFDRIILPTQRRDLIHPYSDNDQCHAILHVHKLEEVLASKLVGLLHRRKVGDIFDLAHAILRNSDYQANRLEVLSTFLKKTIYEAQPQVSKKQLQELKLEESRPFWNQIIAPISIVFDFDEAVRQFQEIVELLFGLLPNPIPTLAPIGYGVSAIRQRPSYRGYSGLSYYNNNYRDMIIQAGESLTMLRLQYHNAWRLVESYALKYHVRKKDNRGLEYFWAFDTSGGNSGKVSIKQFISDDIQDMEITDTPYTPQWPVEL